MAHVNQYISKRKLNLVAITFTVATMLILFEIVPMSNWEFTKIPLRTIIRIKGHGQEHFYYGNSLSYYSKQEDNKENIIAAAYYVLAIGSGSHHYGNKINTKEASTSSSPFPYSSRSSSSYSKSKKHVHSSIRIEEDVFKSLQRESDRQGISVNSLINKILKNYVTSEMYFEQLGFLLVSKDFLRKTFAELQDEKRISEFGKELGLTVAKEYVSYFFPQLNSNTLAQFLDIWFKRFQSCQHRVENIIRYNDDDDIKNNKDRKQEEVQERNNQSHSFTVNHDINMNFSIALKSILEGLIEPITKSPVKFRDITSNSISFSFEIKNSNSSSIS